MKIPSLCTVKEGKISSFRGSPICQSYLCWSSTDSQVTLPRRPSVDYRPGENEEGDWKPSGHKVFLSPTLDTHLDPSTSPSFQEASFSLSVFRVIFRFKINPSLET